ncbi:MAG: hypothetical protein H7A24_02810 [Leptospiraceae bacterium]|nr:hypothetical protein [Leptospiraceae bacterium]MCP5510779.1 hypothetical protein [Leptospiraceae bacterium]
MRQLIILLIIISFQNCQKEYPDTDTCEAYIRLYFVGDTYLEMTGQEPGLRESKRFIDTLLLTCLNAYHTRKSDPPDFYEKPYPR